LVIRHHPREDAANHRDLRSNGIRILIDNQSNAREAIAAADLVTGMNSVLLLEACYLGALVVSLQPNLQGTDALPTNRLGFSRGVYSEGEAFSALREMLLDDTTRQASVEKLAQFRPSGDATWRVAELVCSLLRPNTIPLHS
jgi:hypothetical protein